MLKKTLTIILFVSMTFVVLAKPGIKSVAVFGDSLSDAGNVQILADSGWDLGEGLPYQPFYYQGRGSNGPVWVEVLASVYGYEAVASLAGGTNFAYAGAESGPGFSDQNTPNFQTQIGMWQQAVASGAIKEPMPWQLFVVWFGPNDMLRFLVETPSELVPVLLPGLIQNTAQNIAGGIVALHQMGAELFLVPNMPPLHETPWAVNEGSPLTELLAIMTNSFNGALEFALQQIEANFEEISILRMDVNGLMTDFIGNPSAYDLGFPYTVGFFEPDPNAYLSWDGFHPTAYGHALLAQDAMDVVPVGSWWGHSAARTPGGKSKGKKSVDDSDWPWVYVYGMEGGEWAWAVDTDGDHDAFLALLPDGYKWVFINTRTNQYFDYTAGTWNTLEP